MARLIDPRAKYSSLFKIHKRLNHRFKKRRVWTTLVKPLFVRSFDSGNQGQVQIRQKTLLILRLDLIGDYILFRNFIADIRNSHKYKKHHITFCGNAVIQSLAESLDGNVVDDFLWIERERFIKDKFYHNSIITKMSGKGFETIFQPTFSRDIYSDILVHASQAWHRIGVNGDLSNQSRAQKKITDSFYTHLLQVGDETKFEYDRNHEIVSLFLEESVKWRAPEIKLPPVDTLYAGWNNYAVLVPGASSHFKKWQEFDKVARYLIDRLNLMLVFVGHGKNDYRTILRVMKKSRSGHAVNLCNKTSLLELANTIAHARLVVSNDTAAMHMAAILGRPTVCITSGTHAFRFNNYPDEFGLKIRFVFPPEVERIRGTESFRNYAAQYSTNYDINSISLQRVLNAIDIAISYE